MGRPRKKPEPIRGTVVDRFHRREYCGEFFRAGDGERWCEICAPIMEARSGDNGKQEGS